MTAEPRRITFLALARDCAPYLDRLYAVLDRAAQAGFDVACFIGENGSGDGTRAAIVARAAADPRVTLVPTDAMSGYGGRYERMAAGRDMLAAAAAGRLADEGYVCVLDVDNVLAGDPALLNFAEAAAALEGDAALAGISAGSHPFYYDLLALRVPGYFAYDIGPMLAQGRRSPLFHYLAHKLVVYPTQREVSRRLPLATTSSFNGLCLYRARDYRTARYRRLPTIDECEHVDFNRQVCADGRTILAGAHFTLAMPDEHGPAGAIAFTARRVRKLMGRR